MTMNELALIRCPECCEVTRDITDQWYLLVDARNHGYKYGWIEGWLAGAISGIVLWWAAVECMR